MVQRSGARVGLITTKGHEDTLHLAKGMGRIHGEPVEKPLHITKGRKPVPLVGPDLIAGVTERIDVDGDVIVSLDKEEVRMQSNGGTAAPEKVRKYPILIITVARTDDEALGEFELTSDAEAADKEGQRWQA